MISNVHLPDLAPADDWRHKSACRGTGDLMYPGPGDTHGIDEAKAVCRGCPVQMLCRSSALDRGEPYGVWGGLDEKQRAEILGRRPKPDPDGDPREPASCGRESGYRRHIRLGEKACDRCREARNRARVERRRAGLPP